MQQNRGVAIRFWLGVVQREHVMRGVAQGIAQFNHGSKAAVGRLRESDGVVYYSPRTSYPDGEPLREFTAIGRVADGEVYQASEGPTMTTSGGEPFRPWRRRIDWDLDAVAAPIRPLVGILEFTATPNWGYALRRGLIELSRHDFDIIRAEMHGGAPHVG
ncbi:EVE domain-containing protein [Glaciibacter flavus]|uniref:UPF0310 protein E6C70_15315 n=1 Tax=Orlajensenia flava TaxID=2565934 RepID=A0A4S4FM08_9MICO|nr:EVE domain-containing protein [Glaciibacter flavus]